MLRALTVLHALTVLCSLYWLGAVQLDTDWVLWVLTGCAGGAAGRAALSLAEFDVAVRILLAQALERFIAALHESFGLRF